MAGSGQNVCASDNKHSLCLITTQAPLPAEGPVFFKRKGIYYILGGTTCCACRGGSSVYVFTAPAPLGPWTFRADIGSSPQHYDPHSPTNYVTRAQASDVFQVVGSGRAGGGSSGSGGDDDQWLWLGNQWVTGPQRNRDLQCVLILHQGRHSAAFSLNPCRASERATYHMPRRKYVPPPRFSDLQGYVSSRKCTQFDAKLFYVRRNTTFLLQTWLWFLVDVRCSKVWSKETISPHVNMA
jgi:hypothetical protein